MRKGKAQEPDRYYAPQSVPAAGRRIPPVRMGAMIKQATRQGWLKFYPLDKDKPTSTVPEFESAGDQMSPIINDLKRKNGVIE